MGALKNVNSDGLGKVQYERNNTLTFRNYSDLLKEDKAGAKPGGEKGGGMENIPSAGI